MPRAVARKHTPVAYSPSSYVKQKVSRAVRSVFTLLRRASIALGAFIVWLLSLVTYLNVLPTISRCLKPRRQLRKKQYEVNDSVTYVSGFRDRLLQFVSTESANRKRLLRWVKEQAPSLQHVTDLSSQWCDGRSLCVLINAVVPGTCPGHDLLRREHAVNNCRLAMRLVQRNLGIKEPMTPDEMADAKRINERKMTQYIISMQNASFIPIEEPETPIKLVEGGGGPIEPAIEKECSASGSGLVVAVVDKRARFTITTQTYKYKNLYVEITGPNREKVRRKIVTTKVTRGVLMNGESSQSSKDEQHPEDDGPPEPIPLDYQVIKPGSYQVNYIPRSLGMYQVAITWGGEHIKNSPFKVRSTTAKNIEQTAVRASPGIVKAVSFQDDHDVAAEQEGGSEQTPPSDTESNSTRSRRQSLVRQAHISQLRDSYESTSTSPFSSMCSSMVSSMDHSMDNASDVFLPNHHGHPAGTHPFLSRHNSSVSTGSSRSGSILSRSSSIMYSTERPPTVKTRRKVIRRIIKGAGGTEEVTYPNIRSSSILSSSQMSSMTSTPSISTSMSIDDRSPKFSTSSSSSAASASFARSQSAKNVDHSEKYADHMSKILIGSALNEISRQVATNLMAKRQAKDESDKRDAHLQTDKKPPCGHSPSSSREVIPSRTKPSAVDHKPHSIPQELASDANTTRGAEAEKPHNVSEQSGQPSKQTENPASLDQYLKYRNEFLRSFDKDTHPTDPTPQKTNEDKSEGTQTVARPRQVPSNVKPTHTPAGHIRKTHKKRKEDKATQCTAQDIKTATGWISRRNVYRNAHVNSRQKDSNGDSALGESEGSVVNSSSDKDNAHPATNKVVRRPTDQPPVPGPTQPRGSESSTRQADLDPGGRTIGAPVQHRRGRSGTQSSSQGRQSTFDSGFSDENGHIVGQEHRRNADDIRGRRLGPLVNGKPDRGNRSSTPDNQIGLDRDENMRSTATNSNVVAIQKDSNEQSAEEQTDVRNIPIQIVPASPITPLNDHFKNESSNQGTIAEDVLRFSSDNDSDKEEFVSGQHLSVEPLCLDSSTAPTPGDSSVGNISTPEEDVTFTDCKSNTSSGIPGGKSPSALFDNFAGGVSAGEALEDTETLREMSLDVMLQSLENDPDYSTREFLRKYRPMMEDELGILSQLPTTEPDGDHQEYQKEKADVSSFQDNRTASKEESLAALSQPIPERCHASGVGLYNGIVGEKNNFQVRTLSAGDGSLSVTIRGPRPHTVNETNVVYTGDDLYEIIYDVSLAGFYVISVKWGDKHVPDSPFIVKVTF
ncbi:serine-rich adhesin for platelets-like [Patiria miniata]|uniref:Calponin-homology (CH) domain-containing protein n=1 Tax=Patiria miniata TaxID=46514 RepID=A0A914A507_PATMI|nr:serine-rich adhesin for platelets-like [Patiria miniata]